MYYFCVWLVNFILNLFYWKDEYSHIENLLKDNDGNFTVWFGHYPTSTIVAPYPGVRELMRYAILLFVFLLNYYKFVISDAWNIKVFSHFIKC